jgi:hypothetical protein
MQDYPFHTAVAEHKVLPSRTTNHSRKGFTNIALPEVIIDPASSVIQRHPIPSLQKLLLMLTSDILLRLYQNSKL